MGGARIGYKGLMARHDPTELLTPAEMARADAAALAAGIATETLMEAAGRAVARAIRARFRPCRTLVLAGPGNNGGDGYVAARYLEQAGWPVSVAALAPPNPGTAAATAAARWRGPRVAFSAAEAARAGLVVDALFGAGLTRPLAPEVMEILRAVQAPLVAVCAFRLGRLYRAGAGLRPASRTHDQLFSLEARAFLATRSRALRSDLAGRYRFAPDGFAGHRATLLA